MEYEENLENKEIIIFQIKEISLSLEHNFRFYIIEC